MAPTVSVAGELQWRSSRSAVAARQSVVMYDAAVRPASDESPRSVVVNRGGTSVAQNSQYDPFEDDVPMPEAAAPAAEAQFDPFDADDAAPAVQPSFPEPESALVESPVVGEPAQSAELQEAFAEPSIREDVPTAADELKAAQEAIDREMMRREVEAGADNEIVAPESEAEEEDSSLEFAPEMEDEIVPPADAEGFDEDELMGEEELDLDLQFGEGLVETPEQRAARQRQERIEHERECQNLYEQVREDSIKKISLDIRLQGTAGEDYPFECEGMRPAFEPRAWSQTVYLWKASGLCHKPLYFEQVQLERYGHSWGPVLQPIMSGAHFFGTIPILPYKMGLETPQECIYELGNYRPGSCAPYMITQPGFTWRAAAFEAAAVTAVSAAVP